MKPEPINFEQIERRFRYIHRDVTMRAHLRIVAHAPQEAICDAWGSTGAPGDFGCALVIDRSIE